MPPSIFAISSLPRLLASSLLLFALATAASTTCCAVGASGIRQSDTAPAGRSAKRCCSTFQRPVLLCVRTSSRPWAASPPRPAAGGGRRCALAVARDRKRSAGPRRSPAKQQQTDGLESTRLSICATACSSFASSSGAMSSMARQICPPSMDGAPESSASKDERSAMSKASWLELSLGKKPLFQPQGSEKASNTVAEQLKIRFENVFEEVEVVSIRSSEACPFPDEMS
mmetsp:Transcript_18515/g.44242  ORF Transcript_18515/g.44242 Transcript_18515/m.44242 type:complete len:228 (-) Transcript_18515:133-816(-)